LRVLVIEDGKDNQRLLAAILRRMACSATFADDGKAGVEAWQVAPEAFDCILMDLQMPVMDGLQATALLRRLGCQLPIHALTANAMPEDREACLRAGCDGFLTKPIVRQELLAALAAVTPRRTAGLAQA
jgi:CheY-like chemotaxis protein